MPTKAPFASQAQSRLARAAAHDPAVAARTGFSQKAARKLVDEAHAGHQKVGNLPQHVEKKATGGAVYPPKFVW